jgi:hypothetical protein
MAYLNFPTNPSPGDTNTVGSKTYTWNGYAWIVTGQSITATSLISTGPVLILNTTNSTSSTTGALVVSGGAGFGADVYIDGNLYVQGQTLLTTSSFNVDISEGTDIDIVIDNTVTNLVKFYNISTLDSVTLRGSTTTHSLTITDDTESTSTTTGALVITGGLGVGKRINCESIRIADAILDSSQVSVNTSATTVIDAYHISEFRSAKYLIQIDEGSGALADFELIEILLVVDNSGTVYATEYGVVTSGGDLGTFSSSLLPDNFVRLYFTAYNATNKVIRVLRTGMAP